MKRTRVEYTAEELERRKRKLLSKARVNLAPQRVYNVREYDDEYEAELGELFNIPDGSGLHDD
jgi:hypothetical protein